MAGAFVEFVKNAEKLGKKKGRLPILSAAKFFPFKEERELISLVRNEFERAMNANIELAFNGETFADSLEEMNNNESTLPSTFVEKSRTIANSVDSNARSSFSKQSEMIIGHPYFPPENARQIVETWHSNFLELCKSAENDTKAEISRIVATAKMQGWNKKQVETAVKERLPAKTKHRAELIARTETGKLNSSVVMETMKSVGIRYYKWLSTLDTRCRASHAAMNNVICSLDDPTIYFEDNPENGAKPIKHNRTADMVKLHPGFDFQCRCSMVMWEPEIDSKYEVKEEPITEPLEQAEENARKLAEEARVARLEIAAVKRHAERTTEKEQAILYAWNRRRIMRNAKIRHTERTQKKIEKIQQQWSERQAKIKQAINTIEMVRGEYSGIKGLKIPSTITKAEKQGKYTKAASYAEKFKSKVESEAMNLNLLVDPLDAMKKHGLKEVQKVQESVKKKLEYINQFDIDKKIKKLEFEISYVENTKKYVTWEVAKKAYEKALANAKLNKSISTAMAKIANIESIAKSAKDKTLAKYVNKLKKLGSPTTQAELDAVNEGIAKAEKRIAKINSSLIAYQLFDDTGMEADKALRGNASNNWINSTTQTKEMVFNYTVSYCRINEPLQRRFYTGGKNQNITFREWQNEVKSIENYISREKTPRDMIVTRGDFLNDAYIGRFNFFSHNSKKTIPNDPTQWVGMQFKEGGFMSTSGKKGGGLNQNHFSLELFIPKGSQAAYVEPFSAYGNGSGSGWDGKKPQTSFSKEDEIILQRGSIFEITDVKKQGETWKIKAKLIKQEPDDINLYDAKYVGCKTK
jgi:SPP1 gp7 family putative phage head morphogenesis protein